MPRLMRSHLPGHEGKEYLVLTKAEKNAARAAEFAARDKTRVETRAAALVEEAATSPKPLENPPPFNPNRLAVQTYGPLGLGFIQQTHRYSSTGKYLGEVPLAQAYLTTPEMERNNERDRARWHAKTRSSAALKQVEPIPEALMQASRENAQALSAERLAE